VHSLLRRASYNDVLACGIIGFSGIHYLVCAMGNFCLGGPVSDDVPPGAQRAWCIEDSAAEARASLMNRKRFSANRSRS
jgi:hypothetical protein